MSIKDILDSLPRVERDTMMYAFDANIPRFTEYAPGKYIGVHTDAVPLFICESKAGYWRLGTLAKPRGVVKKPRVPRTPRAAGPRAKPKPK